MHRTEDLQQCLQPIRPSPHDGCTTEEAPEYTHGGGSECQQTGLDSCRSAPGLSLRLSESLFVCGDGSIRSATSTSTFRIPCAREAAHDGRHCPPARILVDMPKFKGAETVFQEPTLGYNGSRRRGTKDLRKDRSIAIKSSSTFQNL